jgi:hypothetical protein
MNSQNNRYLFAENPMIVQRVPIRDVQVYVWCVMSATRITVPIVPEIIDTNRYVQDILVPFLKTCLTVREPMSYFFKTVQWVTEQTTSSTFKCRG